MPIASPKGAAIDPQGRCEGKARGNLVPNHEIASLRSQ